MHWPKYVPEKGFHKILLDFQIEKFTKYRRKKLDFSVPADQRENKRKRKNLAKELKNAADHKDDSDTNSNWYTWNGSQKYGKKRDTDSLEKNQDYPVLVTVKIR